MNWKIKNATNFSLAIIAGVVLTIMIKLNSELSVNSTPILASWVAHSVGTMAALLMVLYLSIQKNYSNSGKNLELIKKHTPVWFYMGGIFGALVVVMGAISVNSDLGLSGSLAFMLVGQVIFGVVTDHFGLFGTQVRVFDKATFLAVLCILSGCIILIFFR